MIYYELNEANSQSKLPKEVVDHGKPFEGLERITGADFMIIPENGNYEKAVELKEAGKNLMEIAKELQVSLTDLVKLTTEPECALHEWLFAGAILVQRKSSYDFVASMGNRLNDAIARMCSVTQKQYQKVILVTGMFGRQDNYLTINGKLTEWTHSSYQGAISSIKYKGATVEFLPDDTSILDWIKIQEAQMLKYKRETTQWVVPTVYYPPDLPELDDPLQLMIPVKDARLSMVSIPGWGSGKVNTLYEYVKQCLRVPEHPSLLELLIYATAWETASCCKGIGKGLIKNAREYVGLKDGEYLFISNGNVTTQKETEE